MQPGEEQALRRRLRQMEARQSSVQRCSTVAATQAGLQEGVRAVQTQLNAVLAEEQAQADALAGEDAARAVPAHIVSFCALGGIVSAPAGCAYLKHEEFF